MKLGRTDRDWAVLAVLTFIAGVVVTGGVISDKLVREWFVEVNWSAWAQVVVAAVVGYAAVVVPKNIAESERNRRSDVLLVLLGNVLTPAAALSNRIATGNIHKSIFEGLFRDLEIQLRTLDSYPAADVPSALLLQHKVEAQFHCMGILEHAEGVRPLVKIGAQPSDGQAAAFGVYHQAISKLMADIGELQRN
jgi:hypothetical protein